MYSVLAKVTECMIVYNLYYLFTNHFLTLGIALIKAAQPFSRYYPGRGYFTILKYYPGRGYFGISKYYSGLGYFGILRYYPGRGYFGISFGKAVILGQCLSSGRNDVLVGVPYASSNEFTEFLFPIDYNGKSSCR